jgi:hypothetical protein
MKVTLVKLGKVNNKFHAFRLIAEFISLIQHLPEGQFNGRESKGIANEVYFEER